MSQKQILIGLKVLLADDDDINIFALSAALEIHGAKVLKASNGQEALDLLKVNEGISIVLMDIRMPILDGFATIKQIKENPQYQEIPVIGLTAHAMPEDKNKVLAAGANDYFSKPVQIEELMKRIVALTSS